MPGTTYHTGNGTATVRARAGDARSRIALLAPFALLFLAFPAIACSCVAYPTLCELLISSRTVFIGTVLTGTEPDDGQEHRGFGKSMATMRVETIMRGLPEGTTQVRVNPSVITNCYFRLKKGERWLIDGNFNESTATVGTGVCSASREISPGSTHIDRIVQSFITGPTLIFGTVRRYKGWDSRYRSDNLIPGAEVALTPIARTAAQSAAPSLIPWSATTDERGGFEVSGLASGDYRFQVKAPGMTVDLREDSTDKDRYRDRVPSTIRIPDRGCVDIPVMMWPDQSISGIVTGADGNPIPGIAVHACSLDPKDGLHRSQRQAKTDANGRYVLPRLPDATYVVGVNVDRSDDTEPYRMTFHPAASSARAAAPIQMRGTSIDNINIQLPPARVKTQVRVRVISATGEPVKGSLVSLWRDDKGSDWNRSSTLTDRAGEVTFELWDGDEYTLYAIAIDEKSMSPINLTQPTPPKVPSKLPPTYRSPNLRIVASPGRTVTLKLPDKPSQ